jgi:hypothetical protein
MRVHDRVLSWVLNSATILIAVLALALVTKQYLTRPVSASLPQGPHIGSRIDLPGVKWPEKGSTLVLAMQPGCHWCEASAGFYRDLIRSNSRGDVHLVPQVSISRIPRY